MRKQTLLQLSLAFMVIAIGSFAYNNPTKSEKEITFEENVEALSNDEDESGTSKGICYNSIKTADGCKVLYCGSCSWVNGMPNAGSDMGYCN